MSKIEERFRELKKTNKKAFIVYIPFGFPSITLTKKIIKSLDNLDIIDVIELGIPFSDPLADGPIIQKANTHALEMGATPQALFATLDKMRDSINTPLLILSYYNPIYIFGLRKFLLRCKQVGVDGVMIVDLPVEEASDYIREARRMDLDTVFFITPTTQIKRAKKILSVSRGFVYYISVTGITGPKKIFIKPLLDHIKKIKRLTSLPLCVGFGIHTKAQVKAITKVGDGVIVGSTIVRFIDRFYKEKDFLEKLASYIKTLHV
jgi:tryptophan synthase alpha chain